MVTQILYQLECTHVVRGPVTLVSGVLHCPVDHQPSPIRDVVTVEWKARCDSCSFARWAGLSEDTAKMFADSHWRKNPGHIVTHSLISNPDAVDTLAKLTAWKQVKRLSCMHRTRNRRADSNAAASYLLGVQCSYSRNAGRKDR